MTSVIHDLSNEEYHHGQQYREFVSSSQLKYYLRSAKAFRYALDHPQEETEAMHFGSLFHEAMRALAQKRYASWFDSLPTFSPPINEKTGQPYGTTTKAYKEALESFLRKNEGNTIVSDADKQTIAAMIHSMLNLCGTTSKRLIDLLDMIVETESSYFYEAPNGVKLKIRPDALTEYKLIDWKTVSLDSLDSESIAKQIIKYRYDISLAMYQYVLHEITGKWYIPYLVFVSKNAPFDCVICDMSDWCFSYDSTLGYLSKGVGAIEFERLLAQHSECLITQSWPGIEASLFLDENNIMKPEIPYFFTNKYFFNI